MLITDLLNHHRSREREFRPLWVIVPAVVQVVQNGGMPGDRMFALRERWQEKRVLDSTCVGYLAHPPDFLKFRQKFRQAILLFPPGSAGLIL